MGFQLYVLACRISEIDPPSGGISPLAWVIIVALAGVIATVLPAVWYRGNRQYDKVYADYKSCIEGKLSHEEEVLSLLRVTRMQMERSRR